MRGIVRSPLPTAARALTGLALAIAAGAGLVACWDHLSCQEADAQTRLLLAEHSACDSDASCRIFDVSSRLERASEADLGVCIDALVCQVAIRQDADETALVARAQDIVDRRRCNDCVVAKCNFTHNLQAFCDPATNHCKLRGVPPGSVSSASSASN